MTLKEFKTWLDQFPEDVRINVVSGFRKPMCKVEEFKPYDQDYMVKYDKDKKELTLGDP